jgi:deazaflavin-dependent oxidoreductase (nitroreductase family)
MYKRPRWATRFFVNGPIVLAVKLGLSPGGAQLLTVRGRSSGEPRTVPVNPLELDGETYLVAPRGSTNWARNLHEAGEGQLRRGRRIRPFRVAEEVAPEDRPPILRAYLDRWASVTRAQFEADSDSPDERIREIAPLHPVYRLDVAEQPA